jgi:hypothetical protein
VAMTTGSRSALALIAAELTAAHLGAGWKQARPAPRISYSAPLRSLIDGARRVPSADLGQRCGPPPRGRRAYRGDPGYARDPAAYGKRATGSRRLLWRR